MTHHDIEGALDAFVQERLSERLDNLDLQQEVEDAMDGYDWQSAVEGVTDDLGLASSESVEELEGIVARIRERQEEGAAARDAQNDVISRIARDLALCMGRDWIGLTDRMEAVENIDKTRQAWRAKTEERLAHLEERLEWRIAALEAVMIGQVADSDPGEIAELSVQASPEVAELSVQASPDRLAKAMDAMNQAVDSIRALVQATGAEDDAHAGRAKRLAVDALQALLDAHQAQQQEGQA